MKLSVYYDEIDGQLHPQYLLLPTNTSVDYATYNIEAPFQRFWPEDFHESLIVITITQGALMRDPFNDNEFTIYIPHVITDLTSNGGNMEHLHQAEYFLVRMDDIEEVMQMNIRRLFID